jgi:hypothetical protein
MLLSPQSSWQCSKCGKRFPPGSFDFQQIRAKVKRNVRSAKSDYKPGTVFPVAKLAIARGSDFSYSALKCPAGCFS